MQKLTTQLKFTTGGFLEFILLKMLSSQTYAPGDTIDKLNALGFKTPKGTLYPLLKKMRANGLVITGYEESEIGTALRTYDITSKGRARLRDLQNDWKKLNAIVFIF